MARVTKAEINGFLSGPDIGLERIRDEAVTLFRRILENGYELPHRMWLYPEIAKSAYADRQSRQGVMDYMGTSWDDAKREADRMADEAAKKAAEAAKAEKLAALKAKATDLIKEATDAGLKASVVISEPAGLSGSIFADYGQQVPTIGCLIKF